MSFIDDCVKFLEDMILGDFNEQQMLSAQLISGAISLVPVLDQVMDARDVSGCIYRINKRGGFAKATLEEKVDLGFAAFGVVPEVGSGFKLVFKPLYKQRKAAKGLFNGGVAMIEQMLHVKKGGAVRWVRALDWAGNTQFAITQANNALQSCIALLEYLAQPHWWCPDRLERLARDIVPGLRSMQGQLAAPIREAATEIRSFMEIMLGEHAAAVAMSVAANASVRGSGTRAGMHSQSKHKTIVSTPRTQARRTQAKTVVSVQRIAYDLYAPLNFALKGLLGEHITEHHVIERKGWGLDWNRHDMHGGVQNKNPGWQSQYRKINDDGVPLYLCTPSVHVLQSGIDSAWFTNRPRPHQFAVVEAKASMSVNPKLLDLLGEANANSAAVAPKRASGRRSAQRGTAVASNSRSRPARQNQKVMQMSHEWIRARIARDLPRWNARMQGNYSRHVFLVTPLQATEHIRAAEKIIEHGLVSQPAGAQQFAAMHAEHNIQTEFDDNDLTKTEQVYSVSGKPKRSTRPKK